MTRPAAPTFEDAYLESYTARPDAPEYVHREYATEKTWRRPALTIGQHDQEVRADRARAEKDREDKHSRPPRTEPPTRPRGNDDGTA